jgi:hypothetical protein
MCRISPNQGIGIDAGRFVEWSKTPMRKKSAAVRA